MLSAEVYQQLNRVLFKTKLQHSAYEHQRKVEAEEQIIVGVNKFFSEKKQQYRFFKN